MLRLRLVCCCVGGYDWDAAVLRMMSAMEVSVERYRGIDAGAQLRALALDYEHTVWIVGGDVFVEERFVADHLKNKLHLKMIASVLAPMMEKYFVLDGDSRSLSSLLRFGRFAYSMHTGASGEKRCDANNPPLVIAKKFGEDMCGVLAPNPYFGSVGDWSAESEKLRKHAAKQAWEDRDTRVFWRGKIRGGTTDEPKSCERNAGNFARISACALTLEFPKVSTCAPTAAVLRLPMSATTPITTLSSKEEPSTL